MDKNNTDQNLIDMAKVLGKLEQGLEDLTLHFTNHLSDHWKDRVIGACNMGLQIIVIILLGIVFFNKG